MKFLKLSVFLIISSLALISCGGGGGGGGDDGGISYSGNTGQATVTSENADELAVTSTSGSGMAVSSENAPMAFRSTETSNLEELSEKIYLALNATSNRTANQTEDLSAYLCDQGGLATATSSTSGDSVTVSFTNCMSLLETEIFSIDGVAVMTINNDGSFSIVYKNFTMTLAGESFGFDGIIACDSSGLICTVSLDFVGLDGRVYRVQNLTISSTGVDSYSISATVYDPVHGYVSINGNVTYGCTNGLPSSGSITFSGATGSEGSISYTDCDSFSVTFEGTTTNYLWTEIL